MNRCVQRRIEFLQVEMAQLLAQLLVACALLFAWYVFFSGRAARALCGSHRDTLALPRSQGYLLHVVIKSANAFGFLRLLKRHANSFTYSGRYSLFTL